MMAHDWRERLLAAIKDDGRSARAISMAAGLGPNFVNQFRNYKKEPAVKQVIKLADTLGVSLEYIFLGDETIAHQEEFFQALRDSTPEGRAAALQVLKTLSSAK